MSAANGVAAGSHIEHDRQKHGLVEVQGGTLKDGFEFTSGELLFVCEVRQEALLEVVLPGSVGALGGMEDTAGAGCAQGSIEPLTEVRGAPRARDQTVAH